MSNNIKTPDYIAYEVTENQDQSFWNRVGAAWNHNDGEGINIQLSSIPLSGKITLRIPKAKADNQE